MSLDAKNMISALLEASSYFNVSDVLVNADLEKGNLVKLDEISNVPKDQIPVKLIREAELTQRESGINPLCIVNGCVQLELGSKRVSTPIILVSVEHKLDKVRNVYSFTLDEDSTFVNPFLLRHLARQLNVNIPSELIDSPKLEGWETYLSELGLIISSKEHILGNFHHHRFSVIKELEEILQATSLSSSLSQILGEGKADQNALSISPFQLFPSDTDHVRVFESVANENTVIQGPPGTGKSQVLTNLVAKCIGEDSSVLVISEKFAALDVIQKKLAHFNLDRLSSISTSKKDIKIFLSDLKESWDYFEALPSEKSGLLLVSSHYENNLQMSMDLLSQDDLVGGVSFSEYQKLLSVAQPTSEYMSNVPELSNYLKEKSNIHLVYEKQLDQLIGRCKPSLFQSDQLIRIDEKVRFWRSELESIGKNSEELTWQSISSTMRLASQLQVFENDLFHSYHRLLRPNSREQKRYFKLKSAYTKLLIQKSELNPSHWKISPSSTEVTAFLSTLATGNYFQRRKLKKRWSQLSEIPFGNCTLALEERAQEIALEQEITQILIKFCDLGITNPEKELSIIDQTLPHFTEGHWEAYHSVSHEQRTELTQRHAVLNNLYRDFRSYFHFKNDDHLIDYFSRFSQRLSEVIQLQSFLKDWDSSMLNVFQFAENFEHYSSIVVHSHKTKFQDHFPQLAGYEPSQLAEKIERVISAEDQEAEQFAAQLNQSVLNKFQEAHTLINAPTKTLNSSQRARKARLKKGKSILVKEFSKTRQHPTLRQLFQSEAREWIQLLKPIWLSNPSQLADCFPMETALFDVVIFDEASQIPLQNAVGALQRAVRAVVAGDEHQMGPTSYFVAKESEPIHLLHQASYHFPKVVLKHHYRSVHPDLIAFSNRHFYGNSLHVFPHYPQKNNALVHRFIPEGIFENRVNVAEAIQVAREIEAHLNSGFSLGIVAFSEEQLVCIWNQLSSHSQDQLNEGVSANTVFFKALENVQGDECDHLIISFGYARNVDGEFHHRFGPMNTVNGRKRLNVLLTRARRQINFFCSVRSEDFKLSDNESVNLIRQWVQFSENYVPKTNYTFPFGLRPTIEGNILHLPEIYTTLSEAKELITLHRVLSDRGWKCAYE